VVSEGVKRCPVPNYVSEELNRICTNAGIQCTVTLDPKDFKKIYQFKNYSQHHVLVGENKMQFLVKAGDYLEFKVLVGGEPKITQWFVWYERAT
jgi:hypothetical protein